MIEIDCEPFSPITRSINRFTEEVGVDQLALVGKYQLLHFQGVGGELLVWMFLISLNEQKLNLKKTLTRTKKTQLRYTDALIRDLTFGLFGKVACTQCLHHQSSPGSDSTFSHRLFDKAVFYQRSVPRVQDIPWHLEYLEKRGTNQIWKYTKSYQRAYFTVQTISIVIWNGNGR